MCSRLTIPTEIFLLRTLKKSSTRLHWKILFYSRKLLLSQQQGYRHLLAKEFQVIYRFLAYFGPFFKVLLLFFKVPQSGKFPIGSYLKVKNHPKSCFRMVYDMSLRWFKAWTLIYSFYHANKWTYNHTLTMTVFLLFSQQDWMVISSEPRRHVFMWIQMAFLLLKKEKC